MAKPLVAIRRLVLLAAGLSLLAAACATNPVTGKRELVLVSEQQEIQMGQEGAAEVAQTIGLVPDSSLQRYVQGVGEALARISQRPQLPWTFRVVDDPTPNAFALPGGYIFVTRGLLGLMTTEAELATVVGHEIGHVTARHQVRALTRAELAQVGLAVGSILSPTFARFGQVAGSGLQLLFLKYDRAAEAQADELGFDYSRRDGYDVKEMADVFEALDRFEARQPNASALPGWLQTHPSGPDRIQKVQQRVAALGDTARAVRAGIVRRPEYMRQVDSLVYGADPRQGFFQATRFIHPALRFQVTFPQGWQTQNLSASVTAVSPRQDAAIQLSLADSGSADRALRAFAASPGLQLGLTQNRSLNGVSATQAAFQGRTDQGDVQGLGEWIDYGGHTYQILGYAGAQVVSAYGSAIDQALASFTPLTDPALLAVQPRRVRVVTTDRALTLADFNTRFPSTIPIEDLAIINQVDGPASSIPARTAVKRVVGAAAPGS